MGLIVFKFAHHVDSPVLLQLPQKLRSLLQLVIQNSSEPGKSQCKRVRNLTSQNDLYDIFYLIYSKNFYVDKGFVVGNHQFFA